MPRYNEYAVQRVADAIYDADTAILNENPDAHEEMADEYWERLASAALSAIDSLYESEAEQPVEYAGIEGGL